MCGVATSLLHEIRNPCKCSGSIFLSFFRGNINLFRILLSSGVHKKMTGHCLTGVSLKDALAAQCMCSINICVKKLSYSVLMMLCIVRAYFEFSMKCQIYGSFYCSF